MITKIAFVSMRVTDMNRAKQFYGEVLGLSHSFDSGEGAYSEFDAPDGKSIGLECVSPEGSPPCLALETDDIEAEVARLQEAGVNFHGPVMDHKVCKMAFFNDTEGNTMMLHQMADDRKKS